MGVLSEGLLEKIEAADGIGDHGRVVVGGRVLGLDGTFEGVLDGKAFLWLGVYHHALDRAAEIALVFEAYRLRLKHLRFHEVDGRFVIFCWPAFRFYREIF